jgi:predicted glycosyltransferase
MMTHQVLAQTSLGKLADLILSKIHYKHIRKYGQCWVIDVAGEPNLSGALAHPAVMPENARYIGLLSQIADDDLSHTSEEHVLILLSGPEPQRSILSDILWEQSILLNRKVVFVEGSNNVKERTHVPPHISYHKQITKDTLLPVLKAASIVVCRSGYSTLMDLVVLDKKGILIPTPGQTEQEYLGKYLHKEGVFMHMSQSALNLEKALKEAEHFAFKKLPLKDGLHAYKKVVDTWLTTI